MSWTYTDVNGVTFEVDGGPVDVTVDNQGSIYLFRPQTVEAHEWIDSHVLDPDAQWFGGALAVEARYAHDLAEGMLLDGLEVK